MIEHPDLARYRPNVGVIVFNRAGKVWLGERVQPKSGFIEPNESWQFPQGGMDPGETAEETAFRELFEETGLRTVRLVAMTPGWLAYDFPEGYAKRKREKWLGQRQKWAVMVFDGHDSEVDLNAHGEREFAQWAWVPFHKAADRIVGFKQPIYRELIASLTPLARYISETESGENKRTTSS